MSDVQLGICYNRGHRVFPLPRNLNIFSLPDGTLSLYLVLGQQPCSFPTIIWTQLQFSDAGLLEHVSQRPPSESRSERPLSTGDHWGCPLSIILWCSTWAISISIMKCYLMMSRDWQNYLLLIIKSISVSSSTYFYIGLVYCSSSRI